MESKFIINLFGTGIRFWICEIPIPLYEEMNKIRLKQKVEWENLLFDFDFLKRFGFNHWSELSSHAEQTGFMLHPQNRIEIKQGAKFIARFRANELMNEDLLFPLYHTNLLSFQCSLKNKFKTLLLIQQEKGLIAKYKFEGNNLTMDNLSFSLLHLQKFHFLTDIYFNENLLKKSAEDSLTVSTLVLEF